MNVVYPMTALAVLAERVGALKGACAQTDQEISEFFSEWKNIGGGWKEHKTTGQRKIDGYFAAAPAITSSLDAAVAFKEAMLPGWEITLSFSQARAGAVVADFKAGIRHGADAPTPAIALVLAVLKALEAKANG
jgi:hypothetical protein